MMMYANPFFFGLEKRMLSNAGYAEELLSGSEVNLE